MQYQWPGPSTDLSSPAKIRASAGACLRQPSVQILYPLVIILTLTIATRLPFTSVTVDDAYITFRYARNIAGGLGFVYNAGEPVLGTTTPLYTLILALLARLGLDMIAVGKFINILADAGTAIVIFRVLLGLTNRYVAWAGAFLFIFSSMNLLYAAAGMETGLYTFLLMLTLLLASRGNIGAAAVAGGVLVLVRPDGLIALAAVGVFSLGRHVPVREAFKGLVLFGALQVPWTVFAIWYFGSPVPHSITAKALTYASADSLDWAVGATSRLSEGSLLGAVVIALAFLVGCGSVLWVRPRRPTVIFVIWFVLYGAAFSLARAPQHPWYYSPLMPVIFLFCCLGAEQISTRLFAFRRMRQAIKSIPRPVGVVGTGLLALLISVLSLVNTWSLAQQELSFQNHLFIPISDWLSRNATDESTICLESFGAIGWYTNRPILDEGGLTTEKTRVINEQTPGRINPAGILMAYEPDFYVAWGTWELDLLLAQPATRDWFTQRYEEVGRYFEPTHAWVWVVYRSRNSSDEGTSQQSD